MRSRRTLFLIAILCLLLLTATARTQTIDPFYAGDYTIIDLGQIAGLPFDYGPLIFKSGDPDTILIGGDANEETAGIYEVAVTRDALGHISGFSGTPVRIANAPGTGTQGLDGGLAYGPGDVGNVFRLFEAAAAGRRLPLGRIHNRRSMIYAGNLAEAALAALGSEHGRGQVYLIADDRPYSTRDL